MKFTPFPKPDFRKAVACLGAILVASSMVEGVGITRAQDEAHGYADRGWQDRMDGGSGFQQWRLFQPDFENLPDSGQESYAGFFLANEEQEGDLGQVATGGLAFGIYANGTGFEEAVAFRRLWDPLHVDEVFSWTMNFGGFATRFAEDGEGLRTAGLALRGGSGIRTIGEVGSDRRLVVAVMEGLSTYQVLDADERFNTEVFVDPEGALFTVRLLPDNRYDLEIQTLGNRRVHRFTNRRLRDGDGPLQSFILFNLNAGTNNVYFNHFQVDRPFRFTLNSQ